MLAGGQAGRQAGGQAGSLPKQDRLSQPPESTTRVSQGISQTSRRLAHSASGYSHVPPGGHQHLHDDLQAGAVGCS